MRQQPLQVESLYGGANIYETYKDCVVLVIKCKDTEVRALLDRKNKGKAKKYRWYYNEQQHSIRSKEVGVPLLHRFLLDITDRTLSVTYKDGNHLNCREDNLQVVDNKVNKVMKSIRLETESTKEKRCYNGITKISNGYLITLEINNEPYTEFFFTEEEAIEAYDDKVIEVYSNAALDSYYSLVNYLIESDPLDLYK